MKQVTAGLAFALLLETTAVALLWWRLAHQLWRHLGAIFILIAIFYHGVSEVVNRIGRPGLQRYGLTLSELDRWQWLIGPAILLFTVAYLIALGKLKSPTVPENQVQRMTHFFDWRVLGLLSLPMYLYVLRGHLGSTTGALQTGTSHTTSGLVSQFLLISIVLTSYSYLMSKGKPQLILRIVVLQSILLLLLGERLPVIAGAVMLMYALSRSGLKLSRRQLVRAAMTLLAAAVVISASRVTTGRQAYGAGSGVLTRLKAVESGLLHPSQVLENFHQQYIDRMDGNDFAAFTVAGIANGYPAMGLRSFENDWKLAVPSALARGKLSLPLVDRNEERAFELRYGMGPMNRLPTYFGTLVGYFGPSWFLAIAALFGAFFGVADRWLQRLTPVRLTFGVGLASSVVFYEQGFSNFTVTMRGVVLVLALVKLIQLAKVVGSRQKFMMLHERVRPARVA
jgi:oligosaccharide repeat unit polymerase